ncbi:MAG: hypothetical protein GC192_22515 [Bacteroidetes bacterium]|nr:hypothetical protein [Bacteroidota bacterium]
MNQHLPSSFRAMLFGAWLLCLPALVSAQGWQQTYPDANGYGIISLSESGTLFNLNLKNNTANAFLSGKMADGSQLAFVTGTADCPINFPGGNFRISQLGFYNYEINATGDLHLRRIEFVPGDCGNIDQIYFDQTYDLPTASQVQVSAVVQSADGQAVMVGGTYGIFPGNAPPTFHFFVKKIHGTTGQELWSYLSPALSETPQLSLPLAVSDGGVLALFKSTPFTGTKLWRIDGNGVQQFSNVFVSDLESPVSSVTEAADGGFFIRSFQYSGGPNTFQPYFLKIAADGSSVFSGLPSNILQSSLGFFTSPITLATSTETSNGGHLLAGKAKDFVGTQEGMYLVLLDAAGATAWVKFYDGLLPDLSASIQTSDGGFLLAGKLGGELFLVKTNGNGDIAPPSPSCTNLLMNPSFDLALDNWNSTGDVVATSNGIASICGAPGSLTQVFPTTAGTVYNASVTAQTTGNPNDAYSQLRFLNASYTPMAVGVNSSNTQGIATSFETRFMTATAPVGAAYVQLLIWKETNGCVQVAAAELCEENNSGGGNCQISDPGVTTYCLDNGTADPFDDEWYAVINPTGTGLGSSFSISGFIQEANLPYGQPFTTGLYAAAISTYLDLTLTDDANGCSIDLLIDNPGTCSGGGNPGIDLELSLAQPNASPAQYGNYTVTATLTNSGAVAATGVQVKFAKPLGTVYTGGNEFTASQGSFNPFGNEIWTVGSLSPGASATLTVSYFLLANPAPAAYAQVTFADQPDADSTPGNGTPPAVNEDDEASTVGGSGSTPKPDLVLANLGVQNSPVAAGSVLSYQFDIANQGTATASGDFNIKAWISTDNVLSNDDIQDGVVQTGNYAAGFSTSNVPGASTIPSSLPNGSYFLLLKVDADNAIAEGNEGNNMLAAPFVVGTGGGGSGVIDLELSMSTNQPAPAIYSTTSIVLEVKNVGSKPAHQVEVEFKKPNNLVYEGGNDWSATKGVFNGYGNEKWYISELLPGESQQLTVNYFMLTENTLKPYAQVSAADESDTDSTPGNGTCCAANEDDEASLTLNAFSGNGSTAIKSATLTGRPVQLRTIDPNPVYFGEINVTIFSRMEGHFDLECYDVFGKLVFTQNVELLKGHNRLSLDVSSLAGGTYLLNMPGQNWRYMPIRFVVARW